MESFYKKVRLVFIPYLVLLVVCLAAYSLINWYFYLRNPSDRIWEYFMFVFAPAGVAGVAVIGWMRPRLRLLTVPAGKGSPQFTLNMLTIMAIAIPMALLQYLLAGVTGKLTKVDVPSSITKKTYSKYYSVAEFAELKKEVFIRAATTKANKGRTLVCHIYLAMPLVDKSVFAKSRSAEDTTKTLQQLFGNYLFGDDRMPLVWLCTEYQLKIKKKVYTKEKEDKFIDDSVNDFLQKGFSSITYMERLGNNNLKNQYKKTIAKTVLPDKLVILDAKFTSFERRNNDRILWMLLGTLLSSGGLLFIFAIFQWDEEKLQAFENKDRIW